MPDAPAATTVYPDDLLLEPDERYARLRDARLILVGLIDREEPLSPEQLTERLVIVAKVIDEELQTMLHVEPTLDPAQPPQHSVLR